MAAELRGRSYSSRISGTRDATPWEAVTRSYRLGSSLASAILIINETSNGRRLGTSGVSRRKVSMRIGLVIADAAVEGSEISAVLERARWAYNHGFATGWVPHIPWSLDGLTSLALAGQVTERMELGSAV